MSHRREEPSSSFDELIIQHGKAAISNPRRPVYHASVGEYERASVQEFSVLSLFDDISLIDDIAAAPATHQTPSHRPPPAPSPVLPAVSAPSTAADVATWLESADLSMLDLEEDSHFRGSHAGARAPRGLGPLSTPAPHTAAARWHASVAVCNSAFPDWGSWQEAPANAPVSEAPDDVRAPQQRAAADGPAEHSAPGWLGRRVQPAVAGSASVERRAHAVSAPMRPVIGRASGGDDAARSGPFHLGDGMHALDKLDARLDAFAANVQAAAQSWADRLLGAGDSYARAGGRPSACGHERRWSRSSSHSSCGGLGPAGRV